METINICVPDDDQQEIVVESDFTERGAAGYNGWTMDVRSVEYTDSEGTSKILRKVFGYTGGTGDVPEDYVDMYETNGGYTDDPEEALSIKGDVTVPEFEINDRMELIVTI
jgi:hypothetical protein